MKLLSMKFSPLPCYLVPHTYLLTYLLHGAESFLRSWPVFAASQEIPCIFMEPESSLPYFFYVYGSVHPGNIGSVRFQTRCILYLYFLCSLYMFRHNAIFRSTIVLQRPKVCGSVEIIILISWCVIFIFCVSWCFHIKTKKQDVKTPTHTKYKNHTPTS